MADVNKAFTRYRNGAIKIEIDKMFADKAEIKYTSFLFSALGDK